MYSWSSKSVLFLSAESKGAKKVEDVYRGQSWLIRSVKLKILSVVILTITAHRFVLYIHYLLK